MFNRTLSECRISQWVGLDSASIPPTRAVERCAEIDLTSKLISARRRASKYLESIYGYAFIFERVNGYVRGEGSTIRAC